MLILNELNTHIPVRSERKLWQPHIIQMLFKFAVTKKDNFCAWQLPAIQFVFLQKHLNHFCICHVSVPNFCNLCLFRKKLPFILLPFWSYIFVRLYFIAILKLVKLLLVMNLSKLDHKLVLYYAFLFFVMIGKLKYS